MGGLDRLRFDNHLARLGPEFFTPQRPTPLPDPYLVCANADVATLLDLDPAALTSPQFVALAAGQWVPPGAEPSAMLYAGHQSGVYVPQLGDGSAVTIGQIRNARGESWDLQLKGCSSRQAPCSDVPDGCRTLGSPIREYLCSEALHHLGVPTTRALAIVGSDHPVAGGDVQQTAAVLVRVAPSHVRFGSFELFFYRRQHAPLRALADYVIARDFPHLDAMAGSRDSYLAFFTEVVGRTARLIAQWQALGFVHGAMNTENMSIVGVTFEPGPYAFLEAFDSDYVANAADDDGRYAFSSQPTIALWNLHCLAQALTPLLSVDECRSALAAFEPQYQARYAASMRAKLGIDDADGHYDELIAHLLEIMQGNAVDYPLFFRRLADFDPAPEATNDALAGLFRYPEAFAIWSEAYRARLSRDGADPLERRERMRRANPRYVLRNWLAQRAIERAQRKDFSEIERLQRILTKPFDDQLDTDGYDQPVPATTTVHPTGCSS